MDRKPLERHRLSSGFSFVSDYACFLARLQDCSADDGGRGLGAVIAHKFAAEGCNIAINYANNEAPAQKLSADIQSEYRVKTVVVHGVRVNLCMKHETMTASGL